MKVVLFALLLVCAVQAQARPSADEVGVCYEFVGDEMTERELCIKNFSTGAGAEIVTFNVNKEEFLFEASDCYDGKNQKNCSMLLNEKPAITFRRAIFSSIRLDDSDGDESSMTCYQQVGSNKNYCHN